MKERGRAFAAYDLPDSFIHFFRGNRFLLPFEERFAATCRRTWGPLFAYRNPVWLFQRKLQPVTTPYEQVLSEAALERRNLALEVTFACKVAIPCKSHYFCRKSI